MGLPPSRFLMKKIYGYYHVCTINNYLEVVEEQLRDLCRSGLRDRLERVYLSVTNNYGMEEINGMKRYKYLPIDIRLIELFDRYIPGLYELRVVGSGTMYEMEILNTMLNDAKGNKGDDYHIVYFHSKGISDRLQGRMELLHNIKTWRELMEHVIFWNWEACYDKIEMGYDIVGCNYNSRQPADKPFVTDHFHGNFWWTHSNHVKRLSPLSLNDDYIYAEMWISKYQCNVYEFFGTGLNHYWQNYSPIPNTENFMLPKRKKEKKKLEEGEYENVIDYGRIVYRGKNFYMQEVNIITNIDKYVSMILTEYKTNNFEALQLAFLPLYYRINDCIDSLYQNYIIQKYIDWIDYAISYIITVHEYILVAGDKHLAWEIADNFMKKTLINWPLRYKYLMNKDKVDESLSYSVDCESYSLPTITTDVYNLVIAVDANYVLEVFTEIRDIIQQAIFNSGYKCSIGKHISMEKNNIVLGANTLIYKFYPDNTIIMNMEQLDNIAERESHRAQVDYLYNFFDKHRVIDYDPFNMDILTKKYNREIGLFKFGYMNSLEFIHSYDETEKDIDVLFFGSITSYRSKIRKELEKTDMKILFLTSTFGLEKINYLKRSRIILNLPGFGNLFQISRIAPLLNNHCFIISPKFFNTSYYESLYDGMILCEMGEIVDICQTWVKNIQGRKEIAEKGYSLFKSLHPSITIPQLL